MNIVNTIINSLAANIGGDVSPVEAIVTSVDPGQTITADKFETITAYQSVSWKILITDSTNDLALTYTIDALWSGGTIRYCLSNIIGDDIQHDISFVIDGGFANLEVTSSASVVLAIRLIKICHLA